MARLWPWPPSPAGTRSAPRLSARGRFYEAISEAESSLAQFSGLLEAPPDRMAVAGLLSLPQRLALRLKSTWEAGPRAWVRWRLLRAGRPARHVQSPREAGIPFVALSANWPRRAAHGAALLLVFLLLWGGGFRGVLAYPVQTNEGGIALVWRWSLPDMPEDLPSAYANIPAVPVTVKRPGLPDSAPLPVAAPETTVARRNEVITYTVQAGDTLTAIASQFGLRLETLYWYNGLKSADLLSIDQKLRVPETDGLLYQVQEGDTLDSIAEAFGVRKGNMIAYAANNLREPYELVLGQKIFVPGASKPIPRPIVTTIPRSTIRLSAPSYASLPGGERFSWPAMGRLTDRFGWTGSRWHTGLDIATSWGTPVYSAAAGTVTRAGWNGDLGYMVEIDHGDGWSTRYGHMARQPEVWEGQWVERGQLIGYVGCTGWCTGPHVHFEIRYQGSYCDPLDYLQ